MRPTSRADFQKQVPRGSVKAVYLSCCWINSQVSDVCQNLFLRELPFLYNRSICGPHFPLQPMGSTVSPMLQDSPVHTPWVVDAFSYEGEANKTTKNSIGGSVSMLSKPTRHRTLCWRDEAWEVKCLDGASDFFSPSDKQTHGRYVKQRLGYSLIRYFTLHSFLQWWIQLLVLEDGATTRCPLPSLRFESFSMLQYQCLAFTISKTATNDSIPPWGHVVTFHFILCINMLTSSGKKQISWRSSKQLARFSKAVKSTLCLYF